MKTANKILLAAAGLIILTVITVIIMLRVELVREIQMSNEPEHTEERMPYQ